MGTLDMEPDTDMHGDAQSEGAFRREAISPRHLRPGQEGGFWRRLRGFGALSGNGAESVGDCRQMGKRWSTTQKSGHRLSDQLLT